MPTYRPRMACRLDVPVYGLPAKRAQQSTDSSIVTLWPQIRSCRLDQNDPNTADAATVDADWRDAGVDPRLIQNAIVSVFLDDVKPGADLIPNAGNRRFYGIASRIQRKAAEGDALSVTIDALDFTTLFIETKPVPGIAIPDYSQTLDQAWSRLCTNIKGMASSGETFNPLAQMADRIVAMGDFPFPVIGQAVAKRFRGGGRVHVQPNWSAWDVWKHVVGMCGLLTWIDQDRCIVATSTAYYTEGDRWQNQPALVWGQNILSIAESVDCKRAGKKVGLSSYDPDSGTTLEAFYPPLHDKVKGKKKKVAVSPLVQKGKGGGSRAGTPDDYDIFEYGGVTDQDALDAAAKRVYEERSRGELEGTLTTREMGVATLEGEQCNLLTLKAGENVRVLWDQTDRELVSSMATNERRRDYLLLRGYSEDAADLMIQAMSDIALLDPTFLTKRVTVSLSLDGDGGEFQVEIGYINRLHAEGGAEAPETQSDDRMPE